jgi:chemotaxis family two-component system response regulator Rcp1
LESSSINILIVEDNLAHLKITEYVFRRNNIQANYFVVRDGQEALDFLYQRDSYSDGVKFPSPDLILLDLNLPKRDGREVLKIIKEDSSLKEIPVVIVSTSDRVEDVSYAFETGAVAYISKSSGFDKFNDELAGVTKYARVK